MEKMDFQKQGQKFILGVLHKLRKSYHFWVLYKLSFACGQKVTGKYHGDLWLSGRNL